MAIPRGGIRAVTVQCFDNQFVYLLGGEETAERPVSQVELFNLADQSLETSDAFAVTRKNFVAVFDPDTEVIFAFGGSSNQLGDECHASYEYTEVPVAAGIW